MQLDLSFYEKKLEKLKKDFQFRAVSNIKQEGKHVIKDGAKLLNLSSNDYLGISANPDIKDDFLSSYKGKIQNPSARLLTGTSPVFKELEALVADLTGRKKVLLFNSGYHANTGIYSALSGQGDAVFTDKLNHASIIDGIKLSGAKLIPFCHLDYDDLENKLEKYRNTFKNSIICSETLFSMDGDFADLKKLVDLKNKFNSILILDEAHSFGVYNAGGGLSKGEGGADLVMGTFGKAIGSYGAFAAGNPILIEYLTNFARPFIFSTALPEISVAFSKYVIENHIKKGILQKQLFEITNYARKKFKNLNILGNSYILPVISGENSAALELSGELIKNGFFVLPIRYPTVKKGSARIRISLNPLITKDEIDKLFDIISKSGTPHLN